MKKVIYVLIFAGMLSLNFSNANADAGGYAVIDSNGVVYGVIVAESSDPFKNGGVVPMEYMGCPPGCRIVQQSTADQNGNVTGVISDQYREVIYNSQNGVFQVSESNIIESQVVTESSSNTSAVETEVSVSRSVRNYEFGVQDLRNTSGEFQMTEVAPAQNTNAQVSTSTKQFTCEESGIICSQRLSNASTTLGEEVISFSERKTNEQILAQAVTEAKTKIREQISLILSMLGKWKIN